MRTKFAILLAFVGLFVTALAGDPTWLAESVITSGGTILNRYLEYNNGHKIVVASNGVRHVVWHDGWSVKYQRYYPETGFWSAETTIFGTTYRSLYPSIALDSDGTTIHVCAMVWNYFPDQWDHIHYKRCTPTNGGNGGWDATVDACDDHVPGWLAKILRYPSIACGPNHQVVMGWGEEVTGSSPHEAARFREILYGTWQPSVLLDPDASASLEYVSVCALQNGDVFLAYQGGTAVTPGILTKRRLSGSWQATENPSSQDWSYRPHAAIDPTTQYPHVVWCHADPSVNRIFHNWRGGSGWLSAPLIASGVGGTANCYDPSCDFKPSGALECCWYGHASSQPDGVVFNEWTSGGGWGTPVWLSDPDRSYSDTWPSITTDLSGGAYVIYGSLRTDPPQLYERNQAPSSPDPWSGSTLSQGYWKNHPYYDPQHPDDPYIEEYLPVIIAGVTVSTVPEALVIFDPPKPLTAWKMLLMQFLAAKLNAAWQNNPSLLAAWYDYPGGDYPFDNQRVFDIFQVADGYGPTTDKATLDAMKTVLWNMNRCTEEDTRCLWDAPFPPGPGPQGAEVSALASKLNLSVVPSLAKSGIFRIAYSLPKAGPAKLKVLDITGRTVMTQGLPTAVGDNVISLDASSWSAGVYIVKLQGDACSQTRKLVIH